MAKRNEVVCRVFTRLAGCLAAARCRIAQGARPAEHRQRLARSRGDRRAVATLAQPCAEAPVAPSGENRIASTGCERKCWSKDCMWHGLFKTTVRWRNLGGSPLAGEGQPTCTAAARRPTIAPPPSRGGGWGEGQGLNTNSSKPCGSTGTKSESRSGLKAMMAAVEHMPPLPNPSPARGEGSQGSAQHFRSYPHLQLALILDHNASTIWQ